jgi:Ca2+-binding RTX toxin-like protein
MPPPPKPPASTEQPPIAPASTTKIQPLTGQPAKSSEAFCPPPQKPPASTGQQAANLPQDQIKASSSGEKNASGNPKQGTEPVGNSLKLPSSAPNQNLEGTTGKDSLEAKAGIDRLTGLSGADTFFFSGKPNSSLEKAIHITDFSAEEGDQIIINRNALGSVSKASNNLATVTSSSNLGDAFLKSDLFIYDSNSGILYVNQNGAEAGFGSGGVFAVLDNHAVLSSSNISIA